MPDPAATGLPAAGPLLPGGKMRLGQRFLRFAGVGALGTALHYLVLIALVSGLACAPAGAAMAGAIAGALANYGLNYRFTFASDRRHREALPRFLAMAGVGVAINGAVVAALTGFGMNYLLAQAAATVAVLGLNFFWSCQWIFTPSR